MNAGKFERATARETGSEALARRTGTNGSAHRARFERATARSTDFEALAREIGTKQQLECACGAKDSSAPLHARQVLKRLREKPVQIVARAERDRIEIQQALCLVSKIPTGLLS